MTPQNTGSANTRHTQTRRRGSTATPGQWWKVWILLAGVGTTLLGWMSSPREQQPPGSSSVLRSVTMPFDEATIFEPAAVRTQRPPGVRLPPAMPQKPVFRAPVTRTRRS